MLLRKVDSLIKAGYINTLKSSSLAMKFYDDLCAGTYDIYFSYDKSTQKELYEAISKDGSDYKSLLICFDRVPLLLDGSKDVDGYATALALYISNQESSLGEEEMMERYAFHYDEVSQISLLSPEDAEYRSRHLAAIESLSKELMSASIGVNKITKRAKVEFQIREDEYYEHIYYASMKIHHDGKVSSIRDVEDALNAALDGGTTQLFAGSSITLSPDMFNDEDLRLMTIIKSKSSFGSFYKKNASSVPLGEKAMVEYLDANRGGEITFDGEIYRVSDKIIDPKASLDNSGMLKFDPSPKGNDFIFNNQKAYKISKRAKEFVPIRFSSPVVLKLYNFALSHPNFRYELFAKEMNETIIPLAEGNLEIPSEYREKHKSYRREIRYYIEYTEQDSLRFHSEFRVGYENVEKDVFASNDLGKKKLDAFIKAISRYSLLEEGESKSQELIYRFLGANLDEIQASCSLFLSDNLAMRTPKKADKISINVKNGIDWMEVSASSLSYSDEELSRIFKAYRKKKKFVRIRSSFIDLANDEVIAKLSDEFKLDSNSLSSEKLPIYQAFKLPSFGESDDAYVGESLKELLEDIKHYKELEVDIPPSIASSLRPYQVEGVKWLYALDKHGLSGILADEMGLGKTLQTIALLSLAHQEKPILIVCPKSLIYNWENEFHRWDPSRVVRVLDGNKAERKQIISTINESSGVVFVISYDSLRNDLDAFKECLFSYVILDEGQNIANVYAKKTKAVKSIQTDHHFVLTGTPIQNSLMDLWSIFDFLMPGYFQGYTEFYHDYSVISEGDEAKKEVLMKKIAPFILKRTKKDVLSELPPKEEEVLTIAMNDEQKLLYDAYLSNARDSLKKGDDRIAILAALTRLRQICVDPSMYVENFESISEKLRMTLAYIRNLIAEGHKVLVFSSFAKSLFHLEDLLKQEGIGSFLIYGQTSAKNRIEMANEFNEKDEAKVMLVSLKAGGTGLNLVGADYVIHLDPWWNLAAESQASDRAHRIGQKRTVTIIKMVCKDSVEEKVLELQDRKKELSMVVSEGDEAISSIDTEDLRFLLD